MNTDRLLKLADFLETEVPAKRFEMEVWASGDLEECGTEGCALGWATTIPEFKKAGLKMGMSPFTNPAPKFGYETGLHAAADFFNITYEQSQSIFGGRYYTTGYRRHKTRPSTVAHRIRKLVGGE